MLSHNCSGFRESIVEKFFDENYSFIFLQETHHFDSSKFIFDKSNRYRTFQVSSMDEKVSNRIWRGGLVTYISNDIVSKTVMVAKSKHYLITQTGKLVCINVYLPHANFCDVGLYDVILGEIVGHVESLGEGYAFILVGDFNSNGRNIISFKRLIKLLRLSDWSSNVLFTYSQRTSGGICATKLDHFLTKNMPQGVLKSCSTNTKLVVKGGHLPLEVVAELPHLEVDNVTSDVNFELPRSSRIDYQKIHQEELFEFRRIIDKIIDDTMKNLKSPYDPISVISNTFERLGLHARKVFPGIKTNFASKNEPGWNIYVKTAQYNYIYAENAWRSAGCPSTGPLAEHLQQSKDAKQSCLREMKLNSDRTVAELMSDQISGVTKFDRSKAWKPIRNVIRGNQSETTPVLNDLRNDRDIVSFWSEYYMAKMTGTKSVPVCDHPELTKLDLTPSEDIVVYPCDVREAIDNLNRDCAYFDQYSPRLLDCLGPKFDTFVALMLSKFINMSLFEQNICLSKNPNFFKSYIRPVIKSSSLNATIPKSYRPISVSHTLTVLIERIIALRFFETAIPPNFYGYVSGRSCEFAVKTLKNVARSIDINQIELAMLDASGAFESVVWEKIFPVLATKNNPKIVRFIWQMYRFNLYECRWNKLVSNQKFYATRGTKQGGVLSGKIFLEYMNILNEQLNKVRGIEYNGLSWNSLFYADDVCLIGVGKVHLQQLLTICESFETNGFVKWNASKSVIISLTSKKYFKPLELSDFVLNGENLIQKSCSRYLGYETNQRLDDSDHIQRQSNRLYAVTNNIERSIPLRLLDDSRLRKIINAYGCIYMLGTMDNYTKKVWQKLKNAHRYLTEVISQFRNRSEHWNPDEFVFDRKDRYIYGRLNLDKLEGLKDKMEKSFSFRYDKYLHSINEL